VREAILAAARRNAGFGEQGANNAGPFIRALGGRDGDLWCALYAGHCVRRGHLDCGLDVPFGVIKSARGLTRAVGAIGRLYTDPRECLPGDLVCWPRGLTSWEGHVGVVDHLDPTFQVLSSWQGNVGRFPAVVRLLTEDITRDRPWRFASLSRTPPARR
jgi:hypothetical protein